MLQSLKKIFRYLMINYFNKNIFNKFKTYTSLNQLDRKMEKYLNYKNGFYIEIGANDGLNQSNTLFLEKKYDWRGVLVEPSEKFQLLIKNRNKLNFFYNEACCSFFNKSKKIEFVYSNLMTIPTNIDSDINDINKHINKSKKFENNIYEFTKIGIPLNDLLLECNAPKIVDFFSLDVEGAELEILKGIDHEKFKFKYLLVEAKNFERMNNFLLSKDYYLIDKLSYHDFLYSYKA